MAAAAAPYTLHRLAVGGGQPEPIGQLSH
jgi:hypothetical protein